MRSVSADSLDIHTGNHSARGDDDGNVRITLEGILVSQGIVIPAGDNGSLALGHGCLFGNHRNEIPSRIDFLKEIETGLCIV